MYRYIVPTTQTQILTQNTFSALVTPDDAPRSCTVYACSRYFPQAKIGTTLGVPGSPHRLHRRKTPVAKSTPYGPRITEALCSVTPGQ